MGVRRLRGPRVGYRLVGLARRNGADRALGGEVGMVIRTLFARCSIVARDSKAIETTHATAKKYHADHAQPWACRCTDCRIEWALDLSDWKTVTCSNCYGEHVRVVWVRLEFQNWGEQNGGEKEMLGRYNFALSKGAQERWR